MRILYIEPFLAGSHQSFTRVLTSGLEARWTTVTMPGRHFKWRMRGAAAHIALEHAEALARPHDVLLCSSYLPVAELVGLCPHLAELPRVLYFHENQIAYPARDELTGERDQHFGFTQLVSALASTRCVFNSAYNRDSFLGGGEKLLRRMPDRVPSGWIERIRERSIVLPVPLDLPDVPPESLDDATKGGDRSAGPVLLWNHRWEHDKDPATFFSALRRLHDRNVAFRIIVCGQRFDDAPPEFEDARSFLADRILHWGFAASRSDYLELVGRAHIVVSAAVQEFFGLSVLEAVHLGARPLVPDRLAYRELFPASYRYQDDADLLRILGELVERWSTGRLDLRCDRRELTRPYLADDLLPRYEALLGECVRCL
jgi:glycosyltransferase involved in cell wall biosynthesis